MRRFIKIASVVIAAYGLYRAVDDLLETEKSSNLKSKAKGFVKTAKKKANEYIETIKDSDILNHEKIEEVEEKVKEIKEVITK